MNAALAVATFYTMAFAGQPLYCDRGNGLVYSTDTAPWVALSVDLYESGLARCGDEILITGDGWTTTWLALDAGPLNRYYIEDFPHLPILVDIPQHLVQFQGMSAKVTVRNLTNERRTDYATRHRAIHSKQRRAGHRSHAYRH